MAHALRRSAFMARSTLLVLAACSSTPAVMDAGMDGSLDVGASDVVTNDVADAGADAAATAPQLLDQQDKLALWLEASPSNIVLGDAGVATWKDLSKSKNDAVAATLAPVVETAVIAGHDAVHFTQVGAALQIVDATSLHFGTDQVYIVAVTRVASYRSFFWDKDILDDAGLNDGIQMFSCCPQFSADGGTTSIGAIAWVNNFASNEVTWTSPEPLADGHFHILSFRRTSATALALGLDDIAPATATVAAIDVSTPGQAATVGSRTAGPPQDFSIAEEIIVHDSTGTVADGDVAAIHAYLKQKYGL